MKSKLFKRKSFNSEVRKYIISLIEINPYLAKKEFKEYLDVYDEDYYAVDKYVNTLIILGEFDEAEEQLKILEELIQRVSSLKRKPGVIEFLIGRVFINKMNLLCRQEKFEELYKYYNENYKLIQNLLGNYFEGLMIFCKCKLGIIDLETTKKHPTSSLSKQIINYDENAFFELVKRRIEVSPNTTGNFTAVHEDGVFVENFPLDEIVKKIKSIILSKDDKRLYYNFATCHYIFKYNNCGKVNGESTNYFRVVCLQNTNQIITMYPAVGCENLPCVDLNKRYDSLDDKPLIKKRNRVEEFNRRFGFK